MWRFLILTNTGDVMKRIPNWVVADLIRILPILIDNLQPGNKSTRVMNSVRITKKIIYKLKTLQDEKN
jgi:hypothetical protein